ncbi:hypothetical protein C7S20_00925 [Christiangramia fulva]|uniref:DUF5777 domain-containing protein n=1 Tax=Christiangramia fulva TaxID=2126553 RepID=A0A2R3Z101_9FLAO|nr:DUF5777 family beta-barrel protein [Christiangramia fulva]AVR43942.1 hypothetical protein C7S20_00925 [Christiangramia fulva]
MKTVLSLLLLCIFQSAFSQDVDSIMNSLSTEKNYVVEATFKSPWLVLSQTNETQKAKNLTVWIAHRFGDIGGEFGGSHTLYGLDAATDIYLGVDYGISDKLTVGIGRSKYNETYNGLLKYRLLQQKEEGLPISVTLFDQAGWITREEFFDGEFDGQADRISNFFQVIVARKFSSGVSFLIGPGYLVRSNNLVDSTGDEDDLFSVALGGRIKLFKRFAIVADYTIVNGLSRDTPGGYFNPFGVGLEIETGGHVFSLNFQNSQYIIANNYIPNTTKSWSDGGVRFGFSISRNFNLAPHKK